MGLGVIFLCNVNIPYLNLTFLGAGLIPAKIGRLFILTGETLQQTNFISVAPVVRCNNRGISGIQNKFLYFAKTMIL
jgi:hypothetical protein